MEYEQAVEILKTRMNANPNKIIHKDIIRKFSMVDKSKYSSVALNQAKDNG